MSAAPEIPLDIRELLHDCILKLFWPKKKIVEFFLSVGCPDKFSKELDLTSPSMTRRVIVVELFSKLIARPDRGFPVFQTMIDRLANWAHFDPYWFEEQAKLDRCAAENAILTLRKAVDGRNAKTENRRQSAKSAAGNVTKAKDLSALTTAFQKMFGSGMNVQARGRLFETFLKELFNRQSIAMGDSYSLNGEQIDGTFKFEGENYIVEAKWQDPSTSTSQLYTFAHKVDGKMHGRGLFISVNGFSHQGIEALVHGKMIKTMLMDGQDISAVLENRISLEKMLDYKIRAAQTRGDVYVCPITQKTKI